MHVVTGGAGFIGSNIVAAMEERKLGQVVVCDRLHEGDKWRNIAKRELADAVPPDDLFRYLGDNAANIESVIHMGAVSATTERDVDLILANNFTLPKNLWRWCSEHRVPLIYASSAATYGDGGHGFADDPSPEGLARLRPLNAYGWSKHLFDRWVARRLADGDATPPHWAGLKFFNAYGPNEYHKGAQMSVVAQVFPRARAGEPARLFKSHNPDYEDGGQMRDFVWVEDCVDVVLWLLQNDRVSGLFNCGTGTARTFKDLISAVYRSLGREARIDYVPTPEEIRSKYQYFTEADMRRLRAAGYDKSFTSLEDGVARYVTGYLDTPDPYR